MLFRSTGTILNIALNISANLGIVSAPFLPFTSEKLSAMLQVGALNWSEAGNTKILEGGHQLGQAALLFEKIEDYVVEAQINKLLQSKKENERAEAVLPPVKSTISFDDFTKLDMRIVTVLEAERMKKSKKLLKLTVDTGLGTRTVLSGVAEHFDPTDLVGKQVTMLLNLAPRKMMGIDSEGMILMAEDQNGSLRLLQPDQHSAPGSTIS